MMLDDVREMTSKKTCKFGEAGSFEHLLFLFCMYLLLEGNIVYGVKIDVFCCTTVCEMKGPSCYQKSTL